MIERAHSGETVAEIFKKYGEDYFRQCEEQVRRGEGGERQGKSDGSPWRDGGVGTGGGVTPWGQESHRG